MSSSASTALGVDGSPCRRRKGASATLTSKGYYALGEYMPTLLDVISHLDDISAGDGYSPGPTIYARRPWTFSSDALVLRGEDLPDGVTTESGHDYLLEVDLAVEAIEVWSAWRDGAAAAPEEATLAVIYYAEHDAYQPLE